MLSRSLACFVALVAAIAMAPAHAADSRNTSGAECQPYSTTTLPSELSFRAHGLKNISTASEYVVCNVIVETDTPAFWTTDKTADVFVTFHSKNVGTARCELYVGSNLDGTPTSYVQQADLAAGQVANLTFSGVNGSAVTSVFMATYPVTLFCRMPPESSILRIRVVENVDAS